MSTLPVPESEFIEKYGALPTDEELEQFRTDVEEAGHDLGWRHHWLNRPANTDMLEWLYVFWHKIRAQRDKDGIVVDGLHVPEVGFHGNRDFK